MSNLSLGDVEVTALIPLMNRATETMRKNARIRDEKAVEIVRTLGINTKECCAIFCWQWRQHIWYEHPSSSAPGEVKGKAARYEHLGMKLERVRSCGDRFHMYDLIRE